MSSWSNLKWICKTGSSCVLWPTFGQIEIRGCRVRKTGRRHISTSGLAYRASGTLFLRYSGLYCRRISHRRLEMLSIRTLGAQNLNLGPEVQLRNRKYIQKMSEVVRNAVKFIFIPKMREKSRRRQTVSSGVLWPTFGQIGIPGR